MKNLELYVHIPFCMKKCNYCDFLSFAMDEKIQNEYADALMREIKFYGEVMKDYKVSTIFIGGGTPTCLDADKMAEILDTIAASFDVASDAEITMECNPGTVNEEKLKKYKKEGVNRLSIGLQSADDEELKCLGRVHTFEDFINTYQIARMTGFSNINVDLISGIPFQTEAKFLKTLQTVVRLKPNHISSYSLIIEDGTPFYKTYKEELKRQEAGLPTKVLPNEDVVYRIYKLTQQYLEKAGYQRYEISNYAQPGYECAHNIGYWTRENYLGLGLGAASLIENVRYANTMDLKDYIVKSMQIERIDFSQEDEGSVNVTNLHMSADAVSRKAQMEEFMFLGLRMRKGVKRQQFQDTFGIPIDGIYKNTIENLKAEGLLDTTAGQIALTERGEELSNYALAQFLID